MIQFRRSRLICLPTGGLKELIFSATAWVTGLCAFIPIGCLFLLAGRFIPPERFDRITKLGCRIILRCLWIRVRVKGRAHFQPQRTYLFVANHVNIFDVFVLYGHIPNRVRGVELDEHFDWFFYGRIIRRLGMIPISQTHARSALESLRQAQTALADGTSILILPEGGRTLDGRLQPFKSGSFRLAKNACVDIVPVVMVGAYEILRKGSLLIRPGRMILRFGEPIEYRSIAHLHPREIESLVYSRMSALIQS